jgi:outer membrane biosynthesis protein TonB
MLRRSVIASGLLHVAVLVATSVAWPASYNLPDETPPAIPVDLITVADVTNVAPARPDPPKVQPLPDPQPPPPPPVAAPPPEEAEVAPEPDRPLPKPEPEKEQVAKAPEHPVRPKLKPVREKPQKFDVDSVLAFLDKSAPQTPPVPAPAVKKAEVPTQGLGAQDAFTLDIKDALLSQMRECWNVPEGAPDPEKLIVQVRVFLTPDGGLAQPPQLEAATRAAAASNPYLRAAAEAALRAVNVCEPYKHLPIEKYQVWREIVMTFDPSKMIGR